MEWIDRIIGIVTHAEDAERGWDRVLRLCAEEQPSGLWSELPRPDTRSDVRAAAEWLDEQLDAGAAEQSVRGVYLGLDTLNMEDGEGHNVEIGVTTSCDPLASDIVSVLDCEWYGDLHLIRGLVDLKAEYQHARWQRHHQFAEYALFLGYSGLVLADALAAISPPTPLLVAWGFHDGDLFLLGRRTEAGFERLGVLG